MDSHDTSTRTLTCPLCGGTSFTEETGRISTRWAFASHRLILKICSSCSLVLQFYERRGTVVFN
jgi:uncharacterized protein